MTNYIDLHTHSTASDGIYSPTELLHKAKEVGLRVLALTDHDTTDGLEEAMQAAQTLDMDLIPGIEINTDVGGGERREGRRAHSCSPAEEALAELRHRPDGKSAGERIGEAGDRLGRPAERREE